MGELTIREELSGLEASKAKQIEAVFAPMVKMLKDFEGIYSAVMELEQSPEKVKKANRLRLDIAKVRTEADKARKAQKEEYLRAGNAIQGVYNILKFAVVDKETALREVETHYERVEAERVANLQTSRAAELSKYDVDGSTIKLGEMEESVWVNFLAGTKTNYETAKEAARKAEEERLEAERIKKEQAEKERLAREAAAKAERERILAENEKVRKENERLLKERKAKEKKEKAAAAKRAAERKAEEAKREKERKAEQAKRDELERKAKADAEKARAENERLLKERKEIEERERAAAQAEQEERDLAAAAPDREKLSAWADELESRIDSLSTDSAQIAVKEAVAILADAAAGSVSEPSTVEA